MLKNRFVSFFKTFHNWAQQRHSNPLVNATLAVYRITAKGACWIWRHTPLPLLILGGAVVLAVMLVVFSPTAIPKPPSEKVWVIRTQTLKPGIVQPEIEQYGELLAGRDIDLRSYVAGEIVMASAHMQEGSIVQAGDKLVSIDPFDYENTLKDKNAQLEEALATRDELQAQSAAEATLLKVDKSQLALKEKDFKRAQTLRKSGTVSEKFLDDAETAYNQQLQQFTNRDTQVKVLNARLARQDATIQRLEAAVAMAERDLERSNITAPFDGFLSEVSADQNKRVGVNEKLARLADVSRLEVQFILTNAQYGRLLSSGEDLIGRPVTVSWQINDNAREYEAHLDRIGGRIDPRTGGIEAFARLTPQPLTTELRPGAFVRVTMKDRKYDKAVIVPHDALYEMSYVFVVEDNRLARRNVNVLGQTGEDWILQGPLKDNDILLIDHLAEAGDGILVEIH